MGKLDKYRKIIKQVLTEHYQLAESKKLPDENGVHPSLAALTLNPSPKLGRGTLNLAPLLPILGEG
ncbi:MAG: hypothetical protein AAGG51_28100, partial [Cyanobacteria bacterium P01_G01_bin.54]